MNIIVIGAGTIGSSIAELLVREGHNLTIIDTNPQRLAEIGDRLDVKTLCGSGSSFETLQSAGISDAHLCLAMTNNDEVNLLTAAIAHQLGAEKTVARVRKREYLEPVRFNIRALLKINLIISPELLTAVEMAKFLAQPDSLALAHFAQNKVHLQSIDLTEKSDLINKQIKDLRLPRGLLIALITREDEVIIPRGDVWLKSGDKITFIGQPELFKQYQSLFGTRTPPIKNICIAGGGETGLYLAETLERHDFGVKLIDANPERCAYLSEVLTKTQVITGDVTNRHFLEEERIHNADVFIAVTGDDETNIMSSLLAKELGVKQCVTKVDRPDYAEVIENLGIDKALSPRLITAEKILGLLKRGLIKSVSLLEEGKVEIIEYEVKSKAPIANLYLHQLSLPRESLVGMLVRNGVVKVPTGQDQILPGDTLIIITRPEVVDKVEQFFTPES